MDAIEATLTSPFGLREWPWPRAVYSAFRLADRACRQQAGGQPLDLVARSICLEAMGDLDAATRDLEAAVADHDLDIAVLRAALARSPDRDSRGAAARIILALPQASLQDHVDAVRSLLETQDVVLQASRDRTGLRGWMAWRGDPAPVLLARREGGTRAAKLLAVKTFSVSAPDVLRATFLLECPDDEAVQLRALRGGVEQDAASFAPLQGPASPRFEGDPGIVTVIVPVYGGLAASRACFEALASQSCRLAMDVVVIDDASPDPALAQYAAEACRLHGWRHIGHSVNAGFAAAINRGLAARRGAQALMLNADAILPPGALDRLLAAAELPAVGTVVPFSNDGGFTSFPVIRDRNRVPSASEALALDTAARRANAGRVVDIASGTGFCMLMTAACLAAVGSLDHRYGRGYYEDVDLCLRARRRGLRNVLAADVYVAHVGSQSFGLAKRALTARNAGLVRERFPDYDAHWASFVRGDPLAPLRSAIERRSVPTGPVRILAGRASRLGPVLDARAAECGRDGVRVLAMSWQRDGAVALRAADRDIPQSLVFGLDDLAALSVYLGRLSIVGIEIAEPDTIPRHALAALTGTGAPLAVYVADRAAARAVRGVGASWVDGLPAVAADPLTDAYLQGRPPARASDRADRARAQPWTDPAASRAPVLERAVIGVPMPRLETSAIRFLSELARCCARESGLVVLGACLDDAELQAFPQVWVTGPMAPRDYPDALRHHAVTHILLPYRDRLFRLLADLRVLQDRPAAYFDWSEGAFAATPGDLGIPFGDDDQAAAERVLAWVGAPWGDEAVHPGRLT